MLQRTALIVDDEPEIVSFLEANLRSDDYVVHAAGSVAAARSKLAAHRPDVVLLDVMLPDATGFDFVREIRDSDILHTRIDPDTPVIMLTARGDEVDRIRGFQRGADDYILKPFSYPELLARIDAVLRRTGEAHRRDIVSVAGINIDTTTREVTVQGIPVDLSTKEFMLLSTLARDPRKVHRKQDLLESVWGFQSQGSTRTLDSHASRLRRKLRPFANGRDYIANVWGIGYRLVALEQGV